MGPPAALSAIEIYDPHADEIRHRGRSLIRLRAREFVPVVARRLTVPDVSFRADGVFWGLRGADEITAALSTTTHRTLAATAAEAAELVVVAEVLEVVPVHHPATGHHSLWFVRDERVVLVAPRRWRYPVGFLGPRILRMLGRAAPSGPS